MQNKKAQDGSYLNPPESQHELDKILNSGSSVSVILPHCVINEGLYRDITLHFKPVSDHFPHYISEKTEEQLQEPSWYPHSLITHEQGQKAQDDRTTELINAVMCPWAA